MSYAIGQRVRFIKTYNPQNAHFIGTICHTTTSLNVRRFVDNKHHQCYGIDLPLLPLENPNAHGRVYVLPDQIEPIDDEDDTYTSTDETREKTIS